MLTTFQVATRYPPPAKAQLFCAFAGSEQRVASLEMWKLFQNNSLAEWARGAQREHLNRLLRQGRTGRAWRVSFLFA